jgi:FlaG/FlaF family flagellin (archaellin)
MFPIASGVAMGQGPAALSITLNKGGFEPIMMERPAGVAVDTNAGDIDVTATAAGGDGSYTYAWTLSEPSGGAPGFDAGNQLSVLAAGTQNAAQYNTLTLRGVPAAGPPADVTQILTCTVTDGNSDTAAISIDQELVLIGF